MRKRGNKGEETRIREGGEKDEKKISLGCVFIVLIGQNRVDRRTYYQHTRHKQRGIHRIQCM